MIKRTGWVRVWLHKDGHIHLSEVLPLKSMVYNLDAGLKKKSDNRRLIGIKKVNIVEGVGLKNYKFPTKETKPISANDNDPLFMSELLL